MKISELSHFNVQNHLQSPLEQLHYLQAALAQNDNIFLQTALNDIAAAKGIHLEPISDYSSLHKGIHKLGFQLNATPLTR